jgi:hypothetical protein
MPQPQTEENTEQPAANEEIELTPKHLAAINAAVTLQMKRAIKDVPSRADLDVLVDKVMEKVRAEKPAEPVPAPKDRAEDEEILKMRRRIEEMERRNEEAEQRAIEVERRAKLDKAEAEVVRLLTGGADPKLKVKDDYVPVLAKHFMGRVKLQSDGNVLLAVKRAPAKGLPPEDMEVELGDGVAGWLRSDEAHAWLPAPTPPPPKAPMRPTMPPVGARATTLAPARPSDSLDDAIARTAQQLAEMGVDTAKL